MEELTREEIIENAIADLEWAIDFIRANGEFYADSLSEDEQKIDDMKNSIDRLWGLIDDKYIRKAVYIQYGVDHDDDLENLPEEIIIPNEIEDDDVADYISDKTGYCVYAYKLVISRKSDIT